MMSPEDLDEMYMRKALEEAEIAFEEDEVPVGAVVICNERVIARAHNMSERLHDATAHAEMLAFTAASEYLNGKYLDECTLYVTLEPCVMCAGASYLTRIGRVAYGASDTKQGYSRLLSDVLHPTTVVQPGVLRAACSEILKTYFNLKRK